MIFIKLFVVNFTKKQHFNRIGLCLLEVEDQYLPWKINYAVETRDHVRFCPRSGGSATDFGPSVVPSSDEKEELKENVSYGYFHEKFHPRK